MNINNMESQKGNAVAVVLVILVVAVVGGYLLLNRNSDESLNPSPSGSVAASATPAPTSTASVSPTPQITLPGAKIKTFNVAGNSFSFSLKEIKVNKGDTVKIVFNNTEGLHDWVIDEFNAKTPRIQAGQSSTITFVADKSGTFEYYCSVGNHRAMGMKGNLIVQ